MYCGRVLVHTCSHLLMAGHPDGNEPVLTMYKLLGRSFVVLAHFHYHLINVLLLSRVCTIICFPSFMVSLVSEWNYEKMNSVTSEGGCLPSNNSVVAMWLTCSQHLLTQKMMESSYQIVVQKNQAAALVDLHTWQEIESHSERNNLQAPWALPDVTRTLVPVCSHNFFSHPSKSCKYWVFSSMAVFVLCLGETQEQIYWSVRSTLMQSMWPSSVLWLHANLYTWGDCLSQPHMYDTCHGTNTSIACEKQDRPWETTVWQPAPKEKCP